MANGLGTLKLLDAIRLLPATVRRITRFYQASTSELYGEVLERPQTEKTPFNPVSPYAVSKLYAFYMVKNYREAYGLYACNGILFNHESPRRGTDFVTRKITAGVAKIVKGTATHIEMGNIDSIRDWGHAADFVRAMWLMLQQDKADDFVISTGETHCVREFIEIAFKIAGISIHWQESGLHEVGVDENGHILVKISEDYFRPCEVSFLHGDCSKAKRVLGWERTIPFDHLVHSMVENDLKLLGIDLAQK